MFDLEEFTVAMNELGMDLTVYPSQGDIVIELMMKTTNAPVGVVRERSVEYALARLVRQLSASKITLNDLVSGDDKLSVL